MEKISILEMINPYQGNLREKKFSPPPKENGSLTITARGSRGSSNFWRAPTKTTTFLSDIAPKVPLRKVMLLISIVYRLNLVS